MCGILGAMFFPTKKRVKNRLWATQHILAEAFAESKERGKDAAGAAMIAGDYYAVVKGPWASDEFMLKDKEDGIQSTALENNVVKPFDAFSQICRRKEEDLSLIVMHTRAKTQGSEYENKNNHPILVPNEPEVDATIIGVHNGTIRNDDLIRNELKKEKALVTDAEVDSAAIFEVIHSTLGDEEPDLEHMDEIAKWLEGLFAICAVSRHHPHKVMFWRDSRPLDYVISEDLGIVFFSSDDKFLKEAIARYNRQRTLFKQRLSLPEISFESRIHTDDWSVLFDTNTVLGTYGDKKFGIEEFAQAKRTVKQIYDTVRLPASSTASNWQGRGYNTYQADKEKAERYLSSVSNAIEKDPIRGKDANVEDLSPEIIEPKVPVLTEEEADNLIKQVPGTGTAATATNETGGGPVVEVEGEIITKTVSDDHPEFPDDITNDVGVTGDVYEAAQTEMSHKKDGESIIGSLDEVIERCVAEAQLDEYRNSLEAIRDLYDGIFEEAFVAGVAWRERTGTEESEELAKDIQDAHVKLIKEFQGLDDKYRAIKENRDETKKLLDKEMEKKARAQNYVFALRITLKAIMETLLSRITSKNKKILVEEVHKALVTNKIMTEKDFNDTAQLLYPEYLKKGCKEEGLTPLKRIDVFLKTVRSRAKSK